MILRKNAYLLFCFLFFLPRLAQAQASEILENYIQEALQNSPVLKQGMLRLEERRLSAEVSRRMVLPDVRFGGNYSLAEGGRQIEFPVGDLLNPVYSTLNTLTQSGAFPQIDNVNEQLLANNFYDARFRIRQPVINKEIEINRKIQGLQVSIQEIEIQVLKREIAREVKLAYFQYLQSSELLEIYEKNLVLLNEQKRVNESLLRNEKIIPSVLERNKSEIMKLESQFFQAKTNQKNAALLFNFLLQRDPSLPINKDPGLGTEIAQTEMQEQPREEISKILVARQLNEQLVELENARRRPMLGAQLDVGSQNFDFKWGGYAMLGISLEIPVWNAGRQKLKVQQALIESAVLDENLRYLESALRLEVELARNRLLSEYASWQSFPVQLSSARRIYEETFRRYREGVSNYLELLDAQTQLTNLETQQVIAHFNVLIRQAELERALAAFPLN